MAGSYKLGGVKSPPTTQRAQKILWALLGHSSAYHAQAHFGGSSPILYYASLVWANAISFRGALRPLERVLRLGSIISCGLLRTTSTDAALMLGGFLPPQLELQRRLIQFWLRSLTYGVDILRPDDSAVKTFFCSPRDVLQAELRRFKRH